MPIHDWTRVDAGTFHAFHTLWIGDMMKALNEGLLPRGYYAMAEQVATGMQPDVLTLHVPTPVALPDPGNGAVAVASAPPRTHLTARPDPRRKPRRPVRRERHLVIRHVSGHQVVALIEIVSPANKDRKQHVRDLAGKVVRSLEAGIHVLLIDLLPPGKHDPGGLHGAVWSSFDRAAYRPPADAALTVVSYAWDGEEPRAYIEPTAAGRSLIDMPLFLTAERYVNVPLEATYQTAYRGMPQVWREVLEQPAQGE
ncbi:MAG: DUF4058 family protein [Gemmataceae bacterium]